MNNNKRPKVLKLSQRNKKSDNNDNESEDILFKNRQIFLYDEIDSDMAKDICSKIISLDIQKEAPITIWIHSDGGCIHSALAIIASMKQAKSEIITVINNLACSAAAMISICGDKRIAFEYSAWMQHCSSESLEDYVKFIKDRMRFGDKIEKIIDDMHKSKTKLTERDINKYQNGELWILGSQLIKKGIVDELWADEI